MSKNVGDRRASPDRPRHDSVGSVNDQIWIVWASRGDYPDRTEYVLCWCETQGDAEDLAARYTSKSAKWCEHAANANKPWLMVEQAQADIGDSSWSYWGDTRYTAIAIDQRAP